MSVLNRPLFQRYARQPMMQQPMQQPMMQQPTGVMASSPELMQASMGYKQGGMVQGYQDGMTVNANSYSDPFLNPPAQEPAVQAPVDITQAPTEFKESITEPTVPTMFGFTEEGVNQEVQKLTTTPKDPMSEAIQTGEAAIESGLVKEIPPELQIAADTLVDPETTPTEETEEILKGMGKESPKGTKGKISAMKALISDTFGVDASRYDNLRSLNRAAVGFAIAEGGDIATALKQGAQGAAAIEEKQLSREDSMSKIALEQVFAEKMAAMRNAATNAGKASDYTPERLRQRAIEAILRNPDQFNVYNAETGQVDPAAVQREADILVTAMAQNDPSAGAVDITDPTATGGGLPVVTNQTEYDALPPGSEFIQNGKTRSKPNE